MLISVDHKSVTVVNVQLVDRLNSGTQLKLGSGGAMGAGAEGVCRSCCAAGPLVRYRWQWMAAYHAAVPLAHANQLPLPRL